MTHINYALSKHSQVFGVDTIKMIPAALIYVIEEQNLMQQLQRMKMPLGTFVNVTLMSFIEFTSVYDILSDSKLCDEL